MHRLILTGLFALAAAPAPVLAQAQPPAAPGAQPLGGALIPGLCLLSQQAVYANAKIGLAATARIKQLSDQAMAGSPAARDVAVADIYRRFLDVVLEEPAVKLVNTWGLSDRYTFLAYASPRADKQEVRPLPFDRQMKPKAAALAMLDAFSRARR